MTLALAIKSALLLAVAGLAASIVRTAAARHLAWTLGVVGALLLPVLAHLLPTPVAGTSWLVAPAALVTPTATAGATTSSWLGTIWVIGALGCALRFARSHAAAFRLVRGARRDGYVDDVPLWRSAAIASPMTIGVLRPRILIPAAWPADRLRAVLAHELGHVRRRDALVQLFAQLACAVYWFDPLAWYAARRLRQEREHACDDLVLDAGVLPSSYACDLVAAAGGHADAICMGGATELRLRRVLDATVPRHGLHLRARAAAGLVAIAATALFACSERVPALSVGAPYLRTGFDVPAPRGSIDLDRVGAEIQGQLGALARCYGNREVVGKVVLHAAITASGEVADQCVTEDTVGDPQVTDCVNEIVAATHFPAPESGSVDVSFPFVFGS